MFILISNLSERPFPHDELFLINYALVLARYIFFWFCNHLIIVISLQLDWFSRLSGHLTVEYIIAMFKAAS